MHIDAHQHFWIYNNREFGWIDDSMAALRRNFLPQDLTPELRTSGFQGSVVVQTRQTLEETNWLLGLADAHESILGVVGWADLRGPDIRSQLKTLTGHRKLVGLRHIVQSEADDRFLLQPEFLRGIEMLEDFDLAFDILIYTKHLPSLTSLCGNSRGNGLSLTIWLNHRSGMGKSTPGQRHTPAFGDAQCILQVIGIVLKPTGSRGRGKRSSHISMLRSHHSGPTA